MQRMLIALAAALALFCGPAYAEKLTDEFFTMDVPAGMKAIAKDEVAKQNAVLMSNLGEAANPQAMPKEKPAYKYGYALPNNREAPLNSPYMLVDVRSDGEVLKTAATVMNAQFKSELASALAKAMNSAPVLLHESATPLDEPYTLEYKVWNRKANHGEIHAFSIAYTDKGYVLAYWFTTAAEYGVYVDKLRAAAQSIEVAATHRRPETPVSPEFKPEAKKDKAPAKQPAPKTPKGK